MASIPFTLAALATSAVPGLEVTAVRAHEPDPDFASAVIVGDGGEMIVRVPRNEAAEVRQSAELLGRAALTEGSRAQLPFAVPETLGMTRAGDSRAVVVTLLPGGTFEVGDLAEDALLLQPLAEAIAAIHELPATVAQQGGLPVRTARDLRVLTTRLIDRATATRLVPQSVQRRWTRIVESAELWDFAPTIVHGSLEADQILVEDDRVTGVLGWSELSVGDPAADLAWLLGADAQVLDSVLARYARHRGSASLSSLRARAVLYHELEVARWLLHGTESHDQSIVDDAVGMLDRLVDVSPDTPVSPRPAALGEEEVEALLDETPEVVDLLSDTAAYEALDEDRMFGSDTDFIEPLRKREADATDPDASVATDAGAGTDAGAASDREAEGSADADGGAGSAPGADAEAGAGAGPSRAGDPDEQLTEPIDDSDLPPRA